jgi:hypothetical protein
METQNNAHTLTFPGPVKTVVITEHNGQQPNVTTAVSSSSCNMDCIILHDYKLS